MPTQYKKISTNKSQPQKKGTYLTRDNWEVMKPFVQFSFKAMAVVGSTLFTLVKLFPKALEHSPEKKKEDRVVKI